MKQFMFVLMQLKLLEFFKNVFQQKLLVDYLVLSRNFNGEIDFVIIYCKFGVIFMEVKFKDKFSKSF